MTTGGASSVTSGGFPAARSVAFNGMIAVAINNGRSIL